MKALNIKISGSYRKAKREIVDFDGLSGTIPFCDTDVALMHIRSRYAPMWIMNDKRFKDRLSSIREVHLDEMTETDSNFSYIGKDIKEMSHEELQDLATVFDLRRVPLYKKSSLRETRVWAYVSYAEHVNGEHIDNKAEDFNFADLPPLIVLEGGRREESGKISNEDVIQAEQESTSTPKQTMSLSDLKQIADQRGIKYSPNIGYDKLYERLYNAQ